MLQSDREVNEANRSTAGVLLGDGSEVSPRCCWPTEYQICLIVHERSYALAEFVASMMVKLGISLLDLSTICA